MPNLPGDIVYDILLTLPAKSICRFRCVSKHWYSLLSNNDLIQSRLKHSIETENLTCFTIKDNDADKFYMHITNSSSLLGNKYCEYAKMDSPFINTDLNNVEILGSCNGRVLMKSRNYHEMESLWLWNPCTNKELKEILIPEVKSAVRVGTLIYRKIDPCTSYGVGYNCDTDDYTIVVATCYTNLSWYRRVCEIDVYSMRSNSWKTLTRIFPYEILRKNGKEEVIFVCGAFHWIVRPLQSIRTCIVNFDIHSEKFHEVAVTPQVDEILKQTIYNRTAVGVLGGCLCLVLKAFCFSVIEVWVMKNYNVKESWTKFFTVQPQLPIVDGGLPDYYVKLLCEFKNGEVLFVTTGGSDERNCCLVLYDPVSKECKVTGIEHIAHDKWNIDACVERSHF